MHFAIFSIIYPILVPTSISYLETVLMYVVNADLPSSNESQYFTNFIIYLFPGNIVRLCFNLSHDI